MSNLPLILRAAQRTLVNHDPSRYDGPTTEDSLPAVLQLTTEGCVLVRSTRNTAVVRETTDDK